VLALIGRCVEQAQPPASVPPLQVSAFHLALSVRGSYEGMLIALPPEHWTSWRGADPSAVAARLRQLARHIDPRQLATSKRTPKPKAAKGYVDGKSPAPMSQPLGSSHTPGQDPERGAPENHPFQGLCLPKQIGPDLNRGGLA
jgi:hypothetical protein